MKLEELLHYSLYILVLTDYKTVKPIEAKRWQSGQIAIAFATAIAHGKSPGSRLCESTPCSLLL